MAGKKDVLTVKNANNNKEKKRKRLFLDDFVCLHQDYIETHSHNPEAL